MARQLIFDLPVRPALGRDDFFVSDANRAAVARIEDWMNWPLGKLALIGPSGSGKTHLAHVWATLTNGLVCPVSEIAQLDPGTVTQSLAVDGLGTDLSDADETHLFHLHNALAAKGLPLLLTAETGPARWPIRLPDLASRMTAADTAVIAPPDDSLLMSVFLKQFADRQILVTPSFVQWLMGRVERSFPAIRDAVERLDHAAMTDGISINRSLATRVLGLGRPSSSS